MKPVLFISLLLLTHTLLPNIPLLVESQLLGIFHPVSGIIHHKNSASINILKTEKMQISELFATCIMEIYIRGQLNMGIIDWQRISSMGLIEFSEMVKNVD